MHIQYFCTFYAYHDFSFPFAGHNDCMAIFKSAANFDLSDEDLEEILSCYNEPVLRGYIPCILAFDYELSLRTQ